MNKRGFAVFDGDKPQGMDETSGGYAYPATVPAQIAIFTERKEAEDWAKHWNYSVKPVELVLRILPERN